MSGERTTERREHQQGDVVEVAGVSFSGEPTWRRATVLGPLVDGAYPVRFLGRDVRVRVSAERVRVPL